MILLRDFENGDALLFLFYQLQILIVGHGVLFAKDHFCCLSIFDRTILSFWMGKMLNSCECHISNWFSLWIPVKRLSSYLLPVGTIGRAATMSLEYKPTCTYVSQAWVQRWNIPVHWHVGTLELLVLFCVLFPV